MQPSLQQPVDRFAKALKVPMKLYELHPRRKGNAGTHAALSPAILMGVLSAFEGFAEDFTATALYLKGEGFGQIALRVGRWSNPTIRDFAKVLTGSFPEVNADIGVGFEQEIYKRPSPTTQSGWQNRTVLNWDQLLVEADAWMQVRHCLAHGQASGWGSERWPAALKKDAVSATTVLRARAGGAHSLGLHEAISGARIYRGGAQHAADLVARNMGIDLDWSKVFKFDV
jgi:hypothetical protein